MNANPSSTELAALRAEVAQLRVENATLRARHEELALADARHRGLMESQVLGVFIGNTRGEVVEINDSFERILGRTREQMTRWDWREWMPAEERSRGEERARLLRETGWCPAWETSSLRPDGTRVSVMTGATMSQNACFDKGCADDVCHVLIWALDISESARAEAELRASEIQMRAIVENLHDGLIITDLNDTILYGNARISEMIGYSNAELIGQNAHKFLVDPMHWASCNARNQQREQGQSGTYEIPLRCRDGSTRWMLINGSPLRDGSGAIVGTIGAHFDFNERKLDETERARFAERLQNSNRDLETFAFAVSHDLKQPLRKIEVFSSRLQIEEKAHLSPQGQLYLDRIRAASHRMASLIDGLLAYSRVATGDAPWSEVDLNQIAREVMLDLELAVERAGAEMQIGELPHVRASATQMRQLLQNLIGNALKYQRPEVPLVVRVAARVSGEMCSIEVADNGRGFEPQQAERIFEIFCRLDGNEDVAGTGVGLTICRAIVERHGGTLTAHSASNEGANFCAKFPVCPPEPQTNFIKGDAK